MTAFVACQLQLLISVISHHGDKNVSTYVALAEQAFPVKINHDGITGTFQ